MQSGLFQRSSAMYDLYRPSSLAKTAHLDRRGATRLCRIAALAVVSPVGAAFYCSGRRRAGTGSFRGGPSVCNGRKGRGPDAVERVGPRTPYGRRGWRRALDYLATSATGIFATCGTAAAGGAPYNPVSSEKLVSGHRGFCTADARADDFDDFDLGRADGAGCSVLQHLVSAPLL